MSKEYPCVYYRGNGLCRYGGDESEANVCVMGPCPYETPSNADRIRAMSDEELVDTLYGLQKEIARHVVIRLGYPGKILAFEESSPQLLEWLKQPADTLSGRDCIAGRCGEYQPGGVR